MFLRLLTRVLPPLVDQNPNFRNGRTAVRECPRRASSPLRFLPLNLEADE